jgi:hypothetical protein
VCCKTKLREFLATGAYIVRRETPFALYKCLSAVLSAIVPKMVIRFASFETHKGWWLMTSVRGIFMGALSFPVSLFKASFSLFFYIAVLAAGTND